MWCGVMCGVVWCCVECYGVCNVVCHAGCQSGSQFESEVAQGKLIVKLHDKLNAIVEVGMRVAACPITQGYHDSMS